MKIASPRRYVTVQRAYKKSAAQFVAYRVGVKEVRATTAGDGRNSESETNDDHRTGNVELDSLMSLEPDGGRGPEVTRD